MPFERIIGVDGVRGNENADVEEGADAGGRGECTGEPRVGKGREEVSSSVLGRLGAFEGTFLVSTIKRRVLTASDEGSGGGEEDSEESESWSLK